MTPNYDPMDFPCWFTCCPKVQSMAMFKNCYFFLTNVRQRNKTTRLNPKSSIVQKPIIEEFNVSLSYPQRSQTRFSYFIFRFCPESCNSTSATLESGAKLQNV